MTTRLQAYWINHLQTLFSSLGRLWRAPLASLMTAAVIGIALALPAGLHVVLDNAKRLSANWDGSARISVFLKQGVTDSQARLLARQVQGHADVAESDYISPDEALEEFRTLSGFGDALKALKDNPLPAVLVIRPTLNASDPGRLEKLVADLQKLPEVDFAQLDMQWVRRLHAIMQIAQRGVFVLAGLLALAVLLIVGNTIRLDIYNRRQEIEVIKMVGGTDAFIRRPFLYGGMWYGLFGGVIAWLLVTAAIWLLKNPVRGLADLYHSGYRLEVMDFGTTAVLLLTAALLGWLGSWLAVGRHLRDIEPA
ncbi:MAG: permease-like cell division protein FtsX [Gammaproteobacteria bacterium]